ncbi:MAG: ABC transporter permease [Pseudomonadota bacterium]
MSDIPLSGAPLSSPVDREEQARQRQRRLERLGAWVMPALVVGITLLGWDWVVRANEIPHYILPGPGLVGETLIEDWSILYPALQITLTITMLALATAVALGVGLAILFSLSKWIEMSLFPYAVILQVTPIISIAPLIFIYVDSKLAGLLICAWIVAFFPILSNTTLGLNSADHGLRDLFRIYGASRWQTLRLLQIPSAMPFFLAGLKIAGGLSLIGAVVAEYVAGTGGVGSGLAYTILEASYRLDIARMFAALALIALTGVAIFATTSLIAHLCLRRWHESALTRER